MRPLDRKLLRELGRSKRSLAAIVAIVALGVMCFVGLWATHTNLQLAREDYDARTRLADFWIELRRVPASAAEELARHPAVAEIRHRIQFPVTVDMPGYPRPIGGLMLTMPDEPKPVVNDLVLRRGRPLTGPRVNEVIISPKFADAHGLGPSDAIDLIVRG
ncbi:MAG: ABC transporter permease, partial [Planctomycetota bacterium]